MLKLAIVLVLLYLKPGEGCFPYVTPPLNLGTHDMPSCWVNCNEGFIVDITCVGDCADTWFILDQAARAQANLAYNRALSKFDRTNNDCNTARTTCLTHFPQQQCDSECQLCMTSSYNALQANLAAIRLVKALADDEADNAYCECISHCCIAQHSH